VCKGIRGGEGRRDRGRQREREIDRQRERERERERERMNTGFVNSEESWSFGLLQIHC
jgi:hypothetical protein